MDYNSWIDQYPALQNVKFGATAQTGGMSLPQAGWGIPGQGAASIADLGALSTSSLPGTAAGDAATAGVGGFQFGANIPTFQLGLGALQTGAGLWNAMNQNKLAKQQFNFTKDVTNTNLNNQISSFNTQLEDRARSRAAVEGQSDAERDAYVDRNRLTRS